MHGEFQLLDTQWSASDAPTVPAIPMRSGSKLAKRSVDLTSGVVLTIVTLPVILILMVASAVAFRANPLFTQLRIGRNGKPFWFVKIRSLHATVSESASKYELTTEGSNRFGRFIRRTHLDELPQFWLLLTGRMSLVGPRPEMVRLNAMFSPEHLRARIGVRPGVTGLWQVSQDADRLLFETPKYDIFYADNQSFRLDMWVVYRTLITVVAGKARSINGEPRWTAAR